MRYEVWDQRTANCLAEFDSSEELRSWLEQQDDLDRLMVDDWEKRSHSVRAADWLRADASLEAEP